MNAIQATGVTAGWGWRSKIRTALLWFIISLFWPAVCAYPSFAADETPAKNVLVLFSWSDRRFYAAVDLLRQTVRSHVQGPVNFYLEYLESQRFGGPGYEESVVATLDRAYARAKPDVLVVIAYPALAFVLRHRGQLFPGTSIVFSLVDPRRIEGQNLGPGVTGVTNRADPLGTLDLALRLHPDTRNVVLLAGTTEFETFWLGVLHKEFRPYQSKLRFIDIVGNPSQELLQRVIKSPPETIVFFEFSPQESPDPVLGRADLLALISRHYPTYCMHAVNYCVGGGAVGGSFIDTSDQRVKAGELVARILNGEKAEHLPLLPDSGVRPYLDWRELRKWHIRDSMLPPDSIILYREPTLWERYKRLIMGAIALIIVQALLIVGLLWQRAKRRKVEASLRESEATLRESEQRFRLVADTAPALIWMSDQNGKYTYLNDKWREFTGSEPQAGLGEGYAAYIHPDDPEKTVKRVDSEATEPEKSKREYRLRTRDGNYRWIFDIAAPRFLADGSFGGFIGSAIDVTDQKLAQEALARVSGQLIEVQEKERTRIARELHDDICQRLALLAIQLDRNTRTSGSPPAQAERRRSEIQRLRQIEQASENCKEIAHSVQALSHELHSSNLNFLGLVPAVRDLCRELSEQHRVVVDLATEEISNPLPRDLSLCVFRVLQEALRNAIKHSGASYFEVSLRGTPEAVELEVRDGGKGFDLEAVRTKGGLGLVSMQERVNLVKGTISFESRPNCGTRITVKIPIPGASKARAQPA